jgi:hypothetical protein
LVCGVVLTIISVFLSEKQDMLKLGDFGLSKNLGGQMFTQTYVGVREDAVETIAKADLQVE